ncbi:MAG: hypothetical protein VKK42_31655 [Lyngbya sp.]|nr:hypothetical protein [Lyngbya sp.]
MFTTHTFLIKYEANLMYGYFSRTSPESKARPDDMKFSRFLKGFEGVTRVETIVGIKFQPMRF